MPILAIMHCIMARGRRCGRAGGMSEQVTLSPFSLRHSTGMLVLANGEAQQFLAERRRRSLVPDF
jgi:hypothetical protein